LGKKKFRDRLEAGESIDDGPSLVHRIAANRALTIAGAALVVVLFAGIGILIVTLLGGDELSEPDRRNLLPAPTVVGPPPEIERSAAADALSSKTWDEMSEEERRLVEEEVERVFANTTFRASNDLIVAIDVFRIEGVTDVSRQYVTVATPGEPTYGEQVTFYCEDPDTGSLLGYRYFASALETNLTIGRPDQFPRPWQTVLSDIDWSQEVVDLGFKEIENRRAHGFEVTFIFKGAPQATGAPRRVKYWFDVENARLLQRAETLVKKSDEEHNTYTLDYGQVPAVSIPDHLERPACVPDLMAKVGD
jgi:hypothetical protein